MFRVEPVEGKPNCYRVYRDCDGGNKQWHPDDMLKRVERRNRDKG